VTTVTLSMISHTNVGKTTLARTLLRREVGEVRDQPHVTTVSEAYTLLETDDARLLLWDTPGFGDSVRLLRRLRREGDPIGWLLHQVWDRVVNRPLWCSQEAVRNIRDEADVVLYLVSAAEEPETAGYLEPELELLSWMGRPVLVLLNQVGTQDPRGAVERWREHLSRFEIVRDVLALDAFSRAWVEESLVLERAVDLLEGDARRAMAALVRAWNDRNLGVFGRSVDALADYLAGLATDREPIGGDAGSRSFLLRALQDLRRVARVDRQRAMRRLFDRLQTSTHALMDRLIALHELSGGSKLQIERRIEDVAVSGSEAISSTTGAIAGGLATGALSGLGADLLAGGLTFGGGAIVGAVLGAAGGAVLGGAYRLIAGREPAVQWQPAALDRVTREALLRYLTVAHFGRGRGGYTDLAYPAHWLEDVDACLERERDALHEAWRDATRGGPGARDEIAMKLRPLLSTMLRDVLRRRFPRAEVLHESPSGA
jgi:GTPase SAR1 family protein